jgi:hypothetical protein
MNHGAAPSTAFKIHRRRDDVLDQLKKNQADLREDDARTEDTVFEQKCMSTKK